MSKHNHNQIKNKQCSSAGRLYTFPAGAVTLLILCLAAAFGASGSDAFALESSLTLTINDDVVSADVAPVGTNGSFNKSSNTTISASTTNATGYTLSIAAASATDSDKLINSGDNTAKLSSITEAVTEEQFKALSGTDYNNKWGYLPSKYNSGANSDFLPAPTTVGDILDVTSGANVTPNEYTLAIGARIDSSVKTGSYTNTYVVRLVANAKPYTLIYDDNVVSNMPADTVGQSDGDTVAVSSTVPVRLGYTFLGWCPGVVTTSLGGTDSCSVTPIAAGGNVSTAGASNDYHLLVMWEKENQQPTMQSVSLAELNTLMPNVGNSTTLKDARDNQEYTITKLADNKYWMTTNLNLAGNTTITCDTTDCDSGYTLPTTNGWQAGGKLPMSDTAGFDTDNYAYVYNSGRTPSTESCGAPGCFSYYSWDAATLGSGRSNTTDNTDAPYSICPKHWHLPNTRSGVNSNTDFRALMIAYGGTDTIQTHDSTTDPTGATMFGRIGPGSTPNFLRSGYYGGSMFYDGGGNGNYWSSTSRTSTTARSLYFGSSSVSSVGYGYRRDGFAVRCVFGD